MDKDLKQHIRKTGTTTVGIVFKDGVIIAADKRGTYGGEGGVSYIAGKDEAKVQKVNDNVIVTIAGVASDLQKVIKLTRAELKLRELRSKEALSVKEAANLFSTIVYQNIRQFSPIMGITHFLLAGYDSEGSYLFDIHPDGYLEEKKSFSATGSGMIQCNPILDSDYKENMSLQEAVKLAVKCINAAMKRDPASGEGLDLYVVTKEGIKQELKKEVKTELIDRS